MNRRRSFDFRNLSILVTAGLFVVMFGAGSIAFPGFFAVQNFLNLFIDNAYLLILAVGMTFVIVSGGIDLSVGSVLALTGMVTASLLEKAHMSPIFVIPLVLLMGTALGFFMGFLIQTFDLPPFIVTLAGLYLARGLCYIVSLFTIAVTNPFFVNAAHAQAFIFGENFLSPAALIAIGVVVVAFFVSRYTKYGRTVFAIGGSEQSALLMGLPVAATKIATYALSGFCSALAGIVFTLYTLSGYGLNGSGMEMDAIASAVIGGTLMTGGVGNIFGTVLGVLVYGIIQVLIVFQGTLNSGWTRIVVGFLMFVFCLLQQIFERRRATTLSAATVKKPAEAAR